AWRRLSSSPAPMSSATDSSSALGSRRSTNWRTVASGWAPRKPSTGLPSFRATTSGMLCTPNAAEIWGFSSTLTLVRTTLPSVSSTAFSMVGPRVRHGPHHGAHRSTTTGTSLDRLMTSASKVASVTSRAAMREKATGQYPDTLRPMEAPPLAPGGSDVAPVGAWLAAQVDGAVPPFDFELIAGGHSTLTSRITGAGGRRFVLRRPPLGHVLPSAHDMGRE